jgi:hypothetical protein
MLLFDDGSSASREMVRLAIGLDFALLVPAAGVTLPLLFAVEFALDEGSAEDPFCSVA